MKNHGKINKIFSINLLHLVFAILLSVPLTPYLYNFQEFSVRFQVEWVSNIIPKRGESCYQFNTKRFQTSEKASSKGKYNKSSYALIYYEKKLKSLFIHRKLVCNSIPLHNFFPLSKYCNDNKVDDLMIVSFIS
jgi:hypothetical protein